MTSQRSLYLFLPFLPSLPILASLAILVVPVALATLADTTVLKKRKNIVTNCSNPNFAIDVPISLFLQFDVVGISDVWEDAGPSFPLAVL